MEKIDKDDKILAMTSCVFLLIALLLLLFIISPSNFIKYI